MLYVYWECWSGIWSAKAFTTLNDSGLGYRLRGGIDGAGLEIG